MRIRTVLLAVVAAAAFSSSAHAASIPDYGQTVSCTPTALYAGGTVTCTYRIVNASATTQSYFVSGVLWLGGARAAICTPPGLNGLYTLPPDTGGFGHVAECTLSVVTSPDATYGGRGTLNVTQGPNREFSDSAFKVCKTTRPTCFP